MHEPYLCTSCVELPLRDLVYLSQVMKCDVVPVKKIEGQEIWSYFISSQAVLSEERMGFVKEKGLVVLLNPAQRNLIPQEIIQKFPENIH